jgi:serine phosphatase RsbU (regulator of sigma subunit)
MFVTVLYGILECKTGMFSYARAGHLPPIVIGANGKQIEIDMDIGQPLGLFDDGRLDLQAVVIPQGGWHCYTAMDLMKP